MKLVRYAWGAEGAWGVVEGEFVEEIRGDLFHPGASTGRKYSLEEIRILPPSNPRKALIIAQNYAAHAREMQKEVPPSPVFVCVSPQAVLAHGEAIRYVPGAQRIDYEGELVVIIGRTTRAVEEADALCCVAGYTCGLDISNRDVQFGPLKNMSHAKSFDTFKPVGPFVETECNPNRLEIELRQNGTVRQHSNTSDMIFPVSRLISEISKTMTLLPGDLIYTGTPSGVGPVAPGDILEVEIQGIGVLKNPVIAG